MWDTRIVNKTILSFARVWNIYFFFISTVDFCDLWRTRKKPETQVGKNYINKQRLSYQKHNFTLIFKFKEMTARNFSVFHDFWKSFLKNLYEWERTRSFRKGRGWDSGDTRTPHIQFHYRGISNTYGISSFRRKHRCEAWVFIMFHLTALLTTCQPQKTDLFWTNHRGKMTAAMIRNAFWRQHYDLSKLEQMLLWNLPDGLLLKKVLLSLDSTANFYKQKNDNRNTNVYFNL